MAKAESNNIEQNAKNLNRNLNMVTQENAEHLAQEYIRKYLNDCGLQTVDDAGNVLVQLCAVAGVMLCATVGYEDAVGRLQAVTGYIEDNMHDVHFKRATLN